MYIYVCINWKFRIIDMEIIYEIIIFLYFARFGVSTIPFCKNICSFCPYCKVRYSAELCDSYIDSLMQEIHLVGSRYTKRKKVTSLYFGGGTPALAANRIKEIVDVLNDHFIITEGIGLELHPDNVNVETLQILKDAGVTIYRKFSCNNAQKRKAGIIGCYHKILSGQRV